MSATKGTLLDLRDRISRMLDEHVQVPDAFLVVRLDDGTYARITSVDVAWTGLDRAKVTRQGVLEAVKL